MLWGKKKSSGSGEHARANAVRDSLDSLDEAMAGVEQVRGDEWSEPPTGVHGPDSEVGRAVRSARSTIPPGATRYGKAIALLTAGIALFKTTVSVLVKLQEGASLTDALAAAVQHLPTLGL